MVGGSFGNKEWGVRVEGSAQIRLLIFFRVKTSRCLKMFGSWNRKLLEDQEFISKKQKSGKVFESGIRRPKLV